MKLNVRSGFLFIFSLLIFCSTLNVNAQQARESFGKNRIQYRNFDWQYLSGENFDIYYYDKQKEIARDALDYLEKEFDRITDLIDYPPYYKTKVFLYRSMTDLRQSNVGLNHTVFNVGGETEFVKPYVEVANLGTVQEFKDELISQVSELLIREMMFGGNLKDVFQSSILMNLPEWFVEGASYYVAKGWSADMDDYIREFMLSNKSKKLSRLSGREAALAGQSVWNFIAEKYGKSSVSNILNYTRVTRNEEKSILITLGVPFKQLMTAWQKYYTDMTLPIKNSYVTAKDSLRITPFQNKTTVYTTVKLSPDGRYLAYAENDRGRYIVRVRSLENGREKTILYGGSKVIKQRVDYRLPLLSWADANTLGVIGVKQGQYVFWLYDLSTKTKLPRELDKFSNVRSLNFSGNGRLVILSADFEGQNDLFLISARKDRVRRLTNDLYDDLDPSFIPNTNTVVFSSNRPGDSVRTTKKLNFESLPASFNLFTYDLDSIGKELKRVTNTLSTDFAPLAADQDNFYYLSDQRGIVNLFRFNRKTSIYTQVTNFSTEIKDYDLNFATNTFAFVTNQHSHQNIYVMQKADLSRQIFTPPTHRKQLQQARVVLSHKKVEEQPNTMNTRDLINSKVKKNQKEESPTVAPPQPKRDSSIFNPAKKTELVNTDNYTFEEEPVKKEGPVAPAETFVSRYMKAQDKRKVSGPFPYEPKFSANSMVTTIVLDPLRGLGVLLETQMNDMLENNRFYGGLMTTVNLKSGDAYLEYQYLPKRIDFSARFDRKGIQWDMPTINPLTEPTTTHYEYNRLEVGAALPFSDRVRLSVKPFAMYTRAVDFGQWAQRPGPLKFDAPLINYYGGAKAELVYDNSISSGLNLIEGTRGKMTMTHYAGLNNKNLGFNQFSIEVRHYQKIYKEIVLALRGMGGSFFGHAPKTYLLGGVDNWGGRLFSQKANLSGYTAKNEPNPLGPFALGQVDHQVPNDNLLFSEFITNLRGFDYATAFGNNVMLLNAELRIPLVKVISNAPISSPLLKNMMFVGFYDVGTSWSGGSPFSPNASIAFTQVGGQSTDLFDAKIKKYLNPWLYSYGAGVRTVLLGYYVKADLAWPVVNYQVNNPRLFISIGFDF